ncbi:MAG: hypothetical protein RLZZ175_1553 [Bacteroidota bacterium]|jgi:hexosaminidase
MNNKSLISASFLFLGTLTSIHAQTKPAVTAKPKAKVTESVSVGPWTANDLKISWEVLENNVNNETNFKSRLVIKNTGKKNVNGNEFNLYFNFARKIKSDLVEGKASIKQINGDFFQLTPNADLVIKAGESITVDFISADWAINYSDAPAGLYIIKLDPATKKELGSEIVKNFSVKPFVNEKQYKRFSGDKSPLFTPKLNFDQNKQVVKTKLEAGRIIPTPLKVDVHTGALTLTAAYKINALPTLSNEKQLLKSFLETSVGVAKAGEATTSINLSVSPEVTGSEAYKLTINAKGIDIVGSNLAGVFYGIQSLKALFPAKAFGKAQAAVSLPYIDVEDAPRYDFRGLHLDVARNFQTKKSILKLLDAMAFYKLNKFHFHLTDDEGWRLEIPTLPELTSVGGSRSHSSNSNEIVPSFGSGPNKTYSGSGFYTKAEFIEILRYANERHIEVIPEIDVPGHSRAAIKAMDARYERLMKEGKTAEATKYLLRDLSDESKYSSVQMWTDNVVCICQESAFNFVDAVVNDIALMYKEANAPLTTLHIGGDEVPHGVWEGSAACKQLMAKDTTIKSVDVAAAVFLKRLSKSLEKYHVKVAGWEEIAFKKVKSENGETKHVPTAEFVNGNYQVYVWNNVWGWGSEDVGYKLANLGYKLILANATHLYFDLAYNKDPEEPGYYWAGFCDTRQPYQFIPDALYYSAYEDRMGNPINQAEMFNGKDLLQNPSNIYGIQGQLWSENIKSQELLEYMAFPRVIALAERAWASSSITNEWKAIGDQNLRKQKMEAAYVNFANILGQQEMPRLSYMNGGYDYRVSQPGVSVEGAIAKINIEFPGLTIRYTLDGTEPTEKSKEVVDGKITLAGAKTLKLKAFDVKGRASRLVTVPIVK